MAAAGLLGVAVFVYLFATLPLPDDLAAQPSTVLDVRGRRIGTLNASVAQRDVQLASLPERVTQAVLAAEDRGFYDHFGISPTGVVRALFTNVQAGEIAAGGSTITQQWIKNAALTSERTLSRKVREAVLALKAERQLSKDEIFQSYLNTVYWGRGAHGIEAAARTYFTVPARQLSVNQAATLAGMIQSPEALDPAEHPEQVDRRRQTVLDGMLDQGWIDRDGHRQATSAGLPGVTPDRGVASGINAYYLDAVIRELTRSTNITNPYTGLRIHTALNPRLQRLAQQAVRRSTAGKEYTGALVSIDVASGGIRALVGGPNYTNQPFNFAVRGGNQVGSAFKVPTLAAFTAAGHHPASSFPGPAELTVSPAEAEEAGCQQSGDYAPNNYGDAAYGHTSVQRATAASINTIFVQMELEVGCRAVIDAATALGIPERRDDQPVLRPTTSLTLGVYDLTAVDMASAYATLAGEGVARPAHLVTRVEGPQGRVLHEPGPAREDAFGTNDSRIVTDVLRGVVTSGTGTAAQIGRPVAGKTGTTDDNRDGWFVGYVPQLATAVWIGTADNSQPEEALTGGGVPAETWAAFMEPAVEPLEVVDFTPPDLTGKQPLNQRPTSTPDGPSPSPTPTPTRTSSPRPTTRPAPSPEPPAPTPTGGPAPTPAPTPSEPAPTPAPAPSPSATGVGWAPIWDGRDGRDRLNGR